MAKKEPPKPLFPLRHQFTDALDNYIQASSNLAAAVGMLLRQGDLKPSVAEVITFGPPRHVPKDEPGEQIWPWPAHP